MNDKKDSNEYSTLSNDIQRDLAAKEGPSEPLGDANYDPDTINQPYNADIQTQLAAKSTEKKNKNKKNSNNTKQGS